ncbi:MAG: hypothetical protein JF886_13665 [Candidatus Dormibacteraeota bacterium]|uniref:Uncharacterized protein n=1 Tax=Candidatus Aeolococcus gillhamiae TaxID=3127015 RepID=A0A934K238_9BACT|nr:hypothetical protein [Candidatus Dormibacteraeota bacterium]
MSLSKAMRIFTAVPAPAAKHLSRRRTPGLRTGAVGATLMLVFACALLLAATTAAAANEGPRPTPAFAAKPPLLPTPTLAPLPVVVSPAPSRHVATRPPAAATPSPLLLPIAPPAPRPAPPATSPPGAVEGIQVQSPRILAPVAVLPAPASSSGAGSSVVPLGLLAAFVATLLIATGLTARHRL